MSKGSRRRPTNEAQYRENYYRMKANDTVYLILGGDPHEIDNDPDLIELVRTKLSEHGIKLVTTKVEGKSFRVEVSGEAVND
jgi:hypothetical protein